MNLPTLRLRTWNTGQSAPDDVPLCGVAAGETGTAELRCLRGASGVHVVLADEGRVRLRAEIAAEPGEIVPLRVDIDEGGVPQLSSRGRKILLLPPDALYDPPAPIRPATATTMLDVAIVIDGTLRSWAPKPPDAKPSQAGAMRLLHHADLWTAHVEQLLELVDRLAQGRQTRVAVLAFGDQEMPAVTAGDLRPEYRLYPAEEERVLRRYDPARLRERLLTLPSTSGGDFVDALADALEACWHLRWDDDARKLLLVSGDSPGSSLLHPLPRGADLCVRQYDVDTEALALHRQGVEIATIYHAPPRHLNLDQVRRRRDLLAAARAQYVRLASVQEAAFEASELRPDAAAELLLQMTDPIGRQASLGELVRAAG
jgi:hypothetical protein